MQPFAGDLFKGMLVFFLLDMGLLAARNMSGLKGQSPWLLLYALGAPLIHASLAFGLACLVGVSLGNTILLMTLAASASTLLCQPWFAMPFQKPTPRSTSACLLA